MEDYLVHHGILGMKWGIRRYQNPDGSLTPAGKAKLKSKSDSAAYKIKAQYTKNGLNVEAYNKAANKMNNGLIDKYNEESKKKYKVNNFSELSREQYDQYIDDYEKMFDDLYKKEVSDLYESNVRNSKDYKKTVSLLQKYGDEYVSDFQKTLGIKSDKEYYDNKAYERGYSKGFIEYVNKMTGGFQRVDDPELIDLMEYEYQDSTGKKARR